MATIAITIAGRAYELACRNGEEDHLRQAAALVDAKAKDAARAMGGMSEARQMLFAALMLADELGDARATLAAQAAAPSPAPPEPDPATASIIERLAERLERVTAMLAAPVSDRVESPGGNA